MNVQCAGNPFMSKCLIEVIQELRDYLGPEARGLSDGESFLFPRFMMDNLIGRVLDDSDPRLWFSRSSRH